MVKDRIAPPADDAGVNFDFDQQPFIVIWEVTRACGLACRHCRAEAVLRRHPLELTTQESFRLIDQVARANPTGLLCRGQDLNLHPQ